MKKYVSPFIKDKIVNTIYGSALCNTSVKEEWLENEEEAINGGDLGWDE